MYGYLVEALISDSATVPQPSEEGGREDKRALLLIVGSAHRGGGFDGSRVFELPKTLALGRGHAEVDATAGAFTGFDDKQMSRVHLRISRRTGGCVVEDAGSLNGTFVDGRRITSSTRLSSGSIVFFGGHAAVFRRVDEAALRALEEEATAPLGPTPTSSPELAVVLSKLRRLAPSTTEMLLVGETGVGKEVYARAIHQASGRSGQFVAINCAAIPSELAESELFGYARGAHSTATDAKPGLIQAADRGTLFLDEIGDMIPPLQAKLLRFMQDRTITPLGTVASRPVNVRILAATTGLGLSQVRSDLLGRLGAEPFQIPPLRDRIEDLGALIGHLAAKPGLQFDPAAFRALCLYGWPRNVRELAKVVEQTMALAGRERVCLADLPVSVQAALATPGAASRPARSTPSRSDLETLLRQHDGNVSHVARALGRRWNVVRRWILRYEIPMDRVRGSRMATPGD